jgi:hypothetical protein
MPNQDIDAIQTFKKINNHLNYRIFKWYELGILGTGKSSSPVIDMTPWVDIESDQALEVFDEITRSIPNFKASVDPYNGAYVPEDINGSKFLNYFTWRADKLIPRDIRYTLKSEKEVAGWVYQHKLAPRIWQTMSYILAGAPTNKDANGHWLFSDFHTPGYWADDLPLFRKWIESWGIFKTLGRIVLFQSIPGKAVDIHRDTRFFPNSMHHVSLQFTKNRPAFVYDEKLKNKIYYNTPVYFFNASDLHGVDATDHNAFTIRIDGEFTPEICKLLGLKDGFSWHTDYPSAKKIKDIQIFEPEERP